MNISIIGTGYVGLVTGVCFSELGHNVVCVDIDKERVDSINKGVSPIYEEGLDDLLKKHNQKGTIRATTDLRKAVLDSDISFISVGTPSGLMDYIDLKYIEEVARDIGKNLKEKKGYHTVVVKSTVVPGTTEHSVLPILEKKLGKGQESILEWP